MPEHAPRRNANLRTHSTSGYPRTNCTLLSTRWTPNSFPGVKKSTGAEESEFRLNVVNAVWGQHDYKFLDPFLDVLGNPLRSGSAADGLRGVS